MVIRFLGTHNAESKDCKLMSFLVDDSLAVEAGCLASELSFEEQKELRWVLLSHGHYDHIRGVPSLAFNCSNGVCNCPDVFSVPKTLEIIRSHLIDGIVYPEFADSSSYLGKPSLKLRPVKIYENEFVGDYKIMAVPVQHAIDAVGFEITSGDGKSLFYTGDTGPGLSDVWRLISPQLIIADTTFPNRLENVAKNAGHLCPDLLKTELYAFKEIKGYLPRVVLVHLSPEYENEIRNEVNGIAKELIASIKVASEGEILYL